jgi:hypothetical protein
MKVRFQKMVLLVTGFLCTLPALAAVEVVTERNELTTDFHFKNVPAPARNDAATSAEFSIVAGRRDGNGGDLDKLHDGQLPRSADAPRENCFFAAGTAGGKLRVDLGRAIEIKQVNTYSWHGGDRGPQVYTLSASNTGKDDWKQVAQVDTRPKSGSAGGQYGVSIADSTDSLGRYRYLLFDIARTEGNDPFGNTFFSEIDVIEAGGPVPEAVTPPASHVEIVEAEGGRYRLAVDTTETPDLTDWTRTELAPVLCKWYPRIVKLLASEGYEAPRKVQIVFSADMQGVAATGGTRVSCAAKWYRQNLKGEARGSIVHELVHVVQQYGLSRRNPHATPTPGWVTEGIADYVRWFLYEPRSHGAEIGKHALAKARYDASYRTTANFLNWVATKYEPQLVTHLNAAARAGIYTEAFWKQRTGHTVQELGDEWKAALVKN